METNDPLVALKHKLRVLYPVGCTFEPIGTLGLPIGGFFAEAFVVTLVQEIFLELDFAGNVTNACFKRSMPGATILVKNHKGFIYVKDQDGKEHYARVKNYPENYNYFNH